MTNNTQWEIERKYLVDDLPEGLLKGHQFSRIKQGYLFQGSDREARVREKSGRFTMTLKQGQGLKRLETEISLTAQQFNALWPLTEGNRIEKRRYSLPHQSYDVTIDVFEKSLDPLILMEVEFPDEQQSEHFTPPDFAGPEVTQDPAFKNANLARCNTAPTVAVEA